MRVIIVRKGSTMKSSIRKLILGWALLPTFLLGTGCASFTSVTVESRGVMKPISMTSNINREYSVVKHFKREQKAPFLFLARLNPGGGTFNLDEELQDEPGFGEGDALVNTSVKSQVAFGDILFPIVVGVGGGLIFPPFFFFLACPFYEDLKTCVVEGDIVKYVAEKSAPAGEKLPPAVEKPAPEQKFDPVTGLPAAKPAPRFDPATGLPINP
jgi:hypothetical protein